MSLYYDGRVREKFIWKTVLADSTLLNAVGELFMKFQFHIGWIIIKKKKYFNAIIHPISCYEEGILYSYMVKTICIRFDDYDALRV